MEEVETLDESGHCLTIAWRNVVAVRWSGPVDREQIHRSLAAVTLQGRRNPQNLVILFEIASEAVRADAIFYARDQFVGVSPNVRAIGVCVPRAGMLASLVRALAQAASTSWRARWAWKVFADASAMTHWALSYADAQAGDRVTLERMFAAGSQEVGRAVS